jgi:ABC-type branched-subunit amino acid transport system substrate-binding protein
MDEGTFTGSTNPDYGNTPEAESAVNAYFAGLNKDGGINGHPVKVISCNDQAVPDEAATCAREAVSDHVVAVISGWHSGDGVSLVPILQSAKIAFIESLPLTPPDYSSPVAFVVGGSAAAFGGSAIALYKSGCKKIGAFDYDISASTSIVGQMSAALKPLGAKIGTVTLSPTESTFAGTVSLLQSGGFDCMVPVISPAQVIPLMEAITAAGVHIKWGQFAANFTAAQFKDMGNAGGNGGLVLTEWLGANGTTPQMKQLVSEFNANSVPFDEVSVGAWTDAELFALVAKGISGTVTASNFLSAMNAANGIDLGTTPQPYQTQTPIATTVFNRVFTAEVFVDTLVNGALVQESHTPINAIATFGTS